jgi:hypothetical protein
MGDVAPSSHHSILIEIPLAGKGSWKNHLNMASMPLAYSKSDKQDQL